MIKVMSRPMLVFMWWIALTFAFISIAQGSTLLTQLTAALCLVLAFCEAKHA